MSFVGPPAGPHCSVAAHRLNSHSGSYGSRSLDLFVLMRATQSMQAQWKEHFRSEFVNRGLTTYTAMK